jgi:hypothetical protein
MQDDNNKNSRWHFNWSIPGIILIAVGVFAILEKFYHIHIDYDKIWPFFLILLGLSFIFPRIFKNKK